jgi:RNA polymerase sigma-70 factor (ECF subfamily)
LSIQSFLEVYRDNCAFVWRSLRRLGVREADLEDACQEVFVVVHRRLEDFDGSSSTKTWVFEIARRVAAAHRRKAHVRREAVGVEVPDKGVAPPQHEALKLERARETLSELLDQLDDEQRAVFVLFELEQMPMKEVASAVGAPLQTAYSRLSAARGRIDAAIRRMNAKERSA